MIYLGMWGPSTCPLSLIYAQTLVQRKVHQGERRKKGGVGGGRYYTYLGLFNAVTEWRD